MLEANGSVKGMTVLSVSDAFVTFPCRSALPALCESVRSQKEKKTYDLFSIFIVLPFTECRLAGIIQHVASSDGFCHLVTCF